MQCRRFSSISDLYPVANSNSHTVLTTKENLHMLPNVPIKISLADNHCYGRMKRESHGQRSQVTSPRGLLSD